MKFPALSTKLPIPPGLVAAGVAPAPVAAVVGEIVSVLPGAPYPVAGAASVYIGLTGAPPAVAPNWF